MQQKVYTKITTIYTYQTLPNLNLFVLKQGPTTQRSKNDQPKNHELTSFENRKQMYGSNKNAHARKILTTILQRQYVNGALQTIHHP